MTPKVRYVPTIIRWQENGKVEERKINIEDGMTFELEQSGHKKFTAKAYDTSKGKTPVWQMSKEDAYNVLGISHAKEDGLTENGRYTYVLNSEDIEVAKKASQDKMTSWIGSGGRFVKSNTIVSENPTKDGGLNILHNATNKNGERETYEISVFNSKKK